MDAKQDYKRLNITKSKDHFNNLHETFLKHSFFYNNTSIITVSNQFMPLPSQFFYHTWTAQYSDLVEIEIAVL